VNGAASPLLEVHDLEVRFGLVRAVDGVSFSVPAGPFGLGLVGESGSGKTTTGRAILRLVAIAGGSIRLRGEDVLRLRRSRLRTYRRTVQIVFQDPTTSLDPRMRVGEAVAEGLRAHDIVRSPEVVGRVAELLQEVGLEAELADRFPHQLSGGQRQRVAIARALAVQPRLLVLDEPTSALDVTVQAKILALMATLRVDRGLAYVLISHNLAIVERLCEEILVLYLGKVVERGPTSEVLARPAHPYTVALRSAVPEIDLAARRSRVVLPGTVPDPADPPPGCPFHPRCPMAIEVCWSDPPQPREIAPGHVAACHRAEEVMAQE
jgi:peptide/nickel transport system ATP-binding protein